MVTLTDYRRELKELYNPPSDKVVLVEVPEMDFLMVDGTGDPRTAPAYREALEALYSASYTLKFMLKKEAGTDYPVAPLEGLWWAADMDDFLKSNREQWQWTMMIMQPAHVMQERIDRAIAEATRKKNLPALSKLRFESFSEGLCAQMMHIGPYSAEGPNILKIHEFIRQSGYALTGKHHEIYLGDPRRAAPEKLKTIIRQPVALPG